MRKINENRTFLKRLILNFALYKKDGTKRRSFHFTPVTHIMAHKTFFEIAKQCINLPGNWWKKTSKKSKNRNHRINDLQKMPSVYSNARQFYFTLCFARTEAMYLCVSHWLLALVPMVFSIPIT